MNLQSAKEWQQAFRAAPKIWYTMEFFQGSSDPTYNFYDSKEAAEVELAFALKHKRRMKIYSGNIHNLALSQQRWEGFKK